MATLAQTARAIRRAPGYALATIVTLAVGLAGALTALAPAWDLLGHPFDFREPGRIVCLSGEGPAGAPFLRPLSAPDFWELQRSVPSLEGLAACRDSSPEWQTAEGVRSVRMALVSPGFFPVMGMPLALGRDFTPAEALGDGSRLLVLTHRFWLTGFGGDRQVLGKTLRLDGAAHTVIGVLAPQAHLPFFLEDAVAFQPLAFRGNEASRGMASCWVFGRLAKGSGLAQLQTELDRLIPALGPPRPAGDRSWGIRARGLLAYWRARPAPPLALTALSGLLILLLACANAAHLMLARNLDRTREWGLRGALGAGPMGLGRPILLEAGILCTLGFLVAWLLLTALKAGAILPSEGMDGPAGPPMVLALAASEGVCKKEGPATASRGPIVGRKARGKYR